ncbi:MAG TPA: ABC transporter permease subunit [Stellaceae bacterium]|nr:ABC transporter permease subunit [Stellaceae bacterium]
MPTIIVVFMKEMVDNLRDRRSIAMAMIYPLIGPLILGMMISFVAGSLSAGVSRTGPMEIPAVGAANAPALAQYLAAHDAMLKPLDEDPAEYVRSGRAPFVLLLPQAQAPQDTKLEVRLISDASRLSSVVPIAQMMDLLHGYEHEIATRRLEALGVPPEITSPLHIEEVNVGRAISLGATFLNMMPPFFIFTLFLGGVYLTLDTTSGERERGSFEPLMINPVSRSEVLVGKFGAGVVFTLIALTVQMLAFWSMLHLVPRESLGLMTPPGVVRLSLLLPICLPLALFAVASQIVIAAVTRSLKEAQTYLGLLPLVPAIAGMLLVFAPVRLHSVLAAIPTFGQTVLMGQVIRSETMSWAMIGISGLATLAVTLLLLALAFRLYEREQILFPH